MSLLGSRLELFDVAHGPEAGGPRGADESPPNELEYYRQREAYGQELDTAD